ncbi:MAG: sigma-70 family RNA polymerase sigma factor [Candidatus Aminicenantes bacterium]|nr:sigma-70 family RNA polymerase sigma factor [Candidatus Aminicenantes bacterium]
MDGWTTLLRDKRDAFVGYVRRRIGEAAGHDAEDIVQDVMVGLFDRADPTIPIRDLGAFVYQALRNRIVDRFRKRRDDLPLLEEILDTGLDPTLEFERREMLDEVFIAMDGLAAEEKAIILATELEGRTFKELAAEWEVPIGTLLARKSRALDKLRKELTGQTINDEKRSLK